MRIEITAPFEKHFDESIKPLISHNSEVKF